jgi:hypothetical protein
VNCTTIWSDSTLAPEELSLIKARYFRSILAAARSYDEASTLRLIQSLQNELPTPGLMPDLAAAEQAAVAAVRNLAESMLAQDRKPVVPWNGATHAIQNWLVMSGDQPQ